MVWSVAGVAGIALSVATLMVGMAYVTALKQQILQARGVETQGRVVDLQVRHGKGTAYIVDYQFTPRSSPGERPPLHAAEDSVLEGMFRTLHKGEAVPVIYDPADPDRCALNFNDGIHRSNPFAVLYVTLAIAFGAIGLSCGPGVLMPIRGYFRDKRLVQWGRAAPARIIDVKQVRGRVKSTRITYEFTDDRGKLVRGVRKYLPSQEDTRETSRRFLATVTGNPTVLYDPRNSARSTLYPAIYVVCCLPGVT